MKRAIFIFPALLWLVIPAYCINFNKLNRDSLKQIINDRNLADSTRIRHGIYLAMTYDYIMPDTMLYYAKVYHEEASKVNDMYGLAYTKVIEGWWYTMNNQNKEALKCYLAALEPAEKSGQPLVLGFVYGELGSGYSQMMMSDKAVEYYLRSIRIYRELGQKEREMGRMNNLAQVYGNTGNWEKAIGILQQVVAISDSMKLEDNRKASALNTLGNYYKHSDLGKAVLSYSEALRLHRKNRNIFFEKITLVNLADFFMMDKQNKYGKVIGDNRSSNEIALSYLEDLEKIALKTRDTVQLATALGMKGIIYIRLGEKGKARGMTERVKKLNIDASGLSAQLTVTNLLAKLYSRLGEHRQAEEELFRLIALNDSADQIAIAEKVSLLTESFEIEQMEGQLVQKEEQLRRNRLVTYLTFGVAGLFLLLAVIILIFFLQKRRTAKLLDAKNREIEKARQRAEQGERFKERFLASMSHEIRTPLNAVIGMTSLLLDEKHTPKTENYLKNIKQGGEHLTGIINDILDLSKIEAGKLELHPAPFSPGSLLEEIQGLLEIRAKEKNLQLFTENEGDVPGWVIGDIGRIRQVLLNLAGNAVKFTDSGSVRVAIKTGTSAGNKVSVTFEVKDTGPGIAREYQDLVFEEFVQAGQEGEQRIAGTGLGLSISKKLAEQMGGTISLVSEPGKGSVFSFTIPLELSSEEAYQAIQREKELSVMAMKGSFRILVVEDNLPNQIVTEGLLERIVPEAVVVTAESGFKALELLEKDPFDLVLMDIRMPGMDGYETTRRLRELKNDNAGVPVVALTASVVRSDIEHCIEAGMNGYVPKPVSRELLAKTIRGQLKISDAEVFIHERTAGEHFLDDLADKPAWVGGLIEICNGKKSRFINYLQLFIQETGKELNRWDELIEGGRHEELASSLHKIKPHLKIFSGEKAWNLATGLEEQLLVGWAGSYRDTLNELKQMILKAQQESGQLAGELMS